MWIEIPRALKTSVDIGPSPSARKVWIEICHWYNRACTAGSPSARKVWIEIHRQLNGVRVRYVTFREEGVD